MSETLLDVRNLSVRYGRVEVIDDLSLSVAPGSITSIIGANGAGKTTTLNALIGLLASRGEILLEGESISRLDVEERVARGMCLVPEKRELFAKMSVRDNLELGAFLRYRRHDKTIGRTLERVYALFPRLKERQAQIAGTLSGGERQMLAIGRALMADPKLLMLDEPSLGLAPLVTAEIFRTIESLRREGMSILLVEQQARSALQVSDFGYVLETGSLALSGPAKELAQDPRVIESYLGSRIETPEV
ncbi:MAG: ABC transporter ATP-binding protein [Rhodospirillaceae bacterium]|nr:ABC transporter ATP-binding protein [Rhodospirillaceae bacterium]